MTKLDNLNKQIELYQSIGFKVIAKDEDIYTAIMERTSKQDIKVHIILILLFWWMLCIPNFIYYLATHNTKMLTIIGNHTDA